jgi:hypothetical protein
LQALSGYHAVALDPKIINTLNNSIGNADKVLVLWSGREGLVGVADMSRQILKRNVSPLIVGCKWNAARDFLDSWMDDRVCHSLVMLSLFRALADSNQVPVT